MTSEDSRTHVSTVFLADLTRVTISRRIEADYKERAAFPLLRRPASQEESSLSAVHWVTPDTLDELLQDANERRQKVKGGLQGAYTNFITVLEQSAKEALKYRDWLSGNEPMVSVDGYDSRRVYVVPHQFNRVDLPPTLKLPGTPGGPPKRASYRDREGRLCYVTRAFHLSPQAYVVTINFTKEVARDRRAKQEAEKEAEKSRPKYKSAEDFRDNRAHYFSALAMFGLPCPEKNCHYEFEPSVLEAVRRKVQEAECLLRSGRVITVKANAVPATSPAPVHAAQRLKTLRLVHSSTGATP